MIFVFGGESIRTRKVDVTGCGTPCQYETLTESKGCNVDACPCELLPPSSEWGAWSECSTNQVCGGQGVQTSERSVVSSVGSSCFQENVMMVKSCNSGPCPCPHSPTQWTEWSKCSVACGGGEQVREREIVLGVGPSCFKQQDLQMKACNIDECPLPGGTTTAAGAATPTPGESVKVSHVTLELFFQVSRCHLRKQGL